MIIPMRCFTCNKHIADKYDAYVEKVINYSNIKSFEEYTNFKKVDNDNILSEDTPSLRAFKELGIDLKYLVKGVKAEADGADRTLDRLKAFQMLWEAADVVPKNKVTQVTGAVFQGFEDDQLLTAKRPELIEGKK